MAKHGGKRKGAGRKSKAEEAGLRQEIDEVVSVEDRQAIWKKLASNAKEGDKPSTELLFAYYYGKPTDKVQMEHSGNVDSEVQIVFKPLKRDS